MPLLVYTTVRAIRFRYLPILERDDSHTIAWSDSESMAFPRGMVRPWEPNAVQAFRAGPATAA